MSEPGPILLVEADGAEVELLLGALAAGGFSGPVEVARDGDAALARLQGDISGGAAAPLPCVVLLELKLPRRSGLEVLAAIRGDVRLRHLPVVVLTASAEPSDIRRSYQAGANAYVVKPVAFAALVETLTDVARFWAGRNVRVLGDG